MGTTGPSLGEPTGPKGMRVDLALYSRRRLFECFRNGPLPVLSISTGRTFHQDGKELLPIAVQAHHALVDGLHVARLRSYWPTSAVSWTLCLMQT